MALGLASLAGAWAVVKTLMDVSAAWKWVTGLGALGGLRGFAFKPPGSYIVMVLVALALGYGYGWLKYNEGYDAAENKYEAAIEEERERQAEERRLAVEDAERRISELEAEVAERDELLQDIVDEASGRTGPGLSIDSMRSLNRIK